MPKALKYLVLLYVAPQMKQQWDISSQSEPFWMNNMRSTWSGHFNHSHFDSIHCLNEKWKPKRYTERHVNLLFTVQNPFASSEVLLDAVNYNTITVRHKQKPLKKGLWLCLCNGIKLVDNQRVLARRVNIYANKYSF